MKKFWQLVSKRHLIFISCIFLIVIVLSLLEPLTKITVEFNDASVYINSTRYYMSVEYEKIAYVELVQMPDRGEVVNGSDDMTIRTGIWTNDTWGEYTVCAIPHASNCIVMHLTDGRIFVFNARSDDYTAELYHELLTHAAVSAE